MIRVVAVGLVVILVWFLLVRLSRELKSADVDWKGWAVFAGFVALAFYLNHVTGIG